VNDISHSCIAILAPFVQILILRFQVRSASYPTLVLKRILLSLHSWLSSLLRDCTLTSRVWWLLLDSTLIEVYEFAPWEFSQLGSKRFSHCSNPILDSKVIHSFCLLLWVVFEVHHYPICIVRRDFGNLTETHPAFWGSFLFAWLVTQSIFWATNFFFQSFSEKGSLQWRQLVALGWCFRQTYLASILSDWFHLMDYRNLQIVDLTDDARDHQEWWYSRRYCLNLPTITCNQKQ
jgi:hypothetical protein